MNDYFEPHDFLKELTVDHTNKLGARSTHIEKWHRQYRSIVERMPNKFLEFIIMDSKSALRSNPNSVYREKWSDEIAHCKNEIRRRQANGASE